MKVDHLNIGDCVFISHDCIEPSSIDLIYADPPYNLSGRSLNLEKNQTGGAFYKMNQDWDTWEPEDYKRFTTDWLTSARRVLKPNGSIYVSCTYHNIAEVISSGKKIGLKLNNILTWFKTNAMPNITKRTFTHSTEFVCWFVAGSKWQFHYERTKAFNPNRTKEGTAKQMRDFLDFIELPILQGNERLRGADGRALHPTQKPERLIELILTASSSEGDLVLDPFFGTGTTGTVAKKMNRHWIGIELCPDYARIALSRIYGQETLNYARD